MIYVLRSVSLSLSLCVVPPPLSPPLCTAVRRLTLRAALRRRERGRGTPQSPRIQKKPRPLLQRRRTMMGSRYTLYTPVHWKLHDMTNTITAITGQEVMSSLITSKRSVSAVWTCSACWVTNSWDYSLIYSHSAQCV